MSIRFDSVPHGFLVFDGEHKLAAIYSTQVCIDPTQMTGIEGTVHSRGATIYKPMSRGEWTIHFTSPSMKIEVLEAIIKVFPS
jgi:hypothetical protein